jgi:hypothetical protein
MDFAVGCHLYDEPELAERRQRKLRQKLRQKPAVVEAMAKTSRLTSYPAQDIAKLLRWNDVFGRLKIGAPPPEGEEARSVAL